MEDRMGKLAMKLIISILEEDLKSGEAGGETPTIMFVCGGKKKEDGVSTTEGEEEEVFF